jgi:chemotaxis protein MotB
MSVRVVNGRILVTLRSAVLFDPGKDELKKKGRNLLADLALELKHLTSRHVHVAGHTDDLRLRYSPFRSNWELSALRAVRVVRFLRQMGVKPYRLSAGAFAEYRPLTENASWQGRWLNGRIEISLFAIARAHPLN